MPFIWDDNQYLLVDEDDYYDKKRFVIARKLFITYNKEDDESGNQQFNAEFIERRFRKFGTIESIEILPKNRAEAYVTFKSDRNAYLALAHNELQSRRSTRHFSMQPADTWIQPNSHVDDQMQLDDEYTPEMFMLNEDCILEIAKYLDFDSLVNFSEVCKLFHRILHQHCFPRHHTFAIRNDSPTISMPLAKVRRSLICIGPHIRELTFKWHDYDHNNRLLRFLEKLGQYVGQNIQCVRFRNTLLCDDHIQAIKNILQRLQTLEIIVYNPDFDLDLDFTALCPNLRKFKLLENMQLNRCCKPWPNLEHLSIVGNEYMEVSTFRSFTEQNPQLKCLKFTAYHADDRLQAVAQNLPNVEQLTILPSFPNLSATNIVYLSSLQHLTKLNLMYLDENDINGILMCLTRFTGLRVLKLQILDDSTDDDGHFEPNQQSLIALAQELPHLQQFNTMYLKWKESTVIDFIRFASQLTAMHMHWCDLTITNSMVWKIVKVLQTNRPQSQTTSIKLFVNPSGVIGLQMIDDPNVARYLSVSTECRHFLSAQ